MIIYAGAIMVLFVFVVMMLNLGRRSVEQERAWLQPAHVDRARASWRRSCWSKLIYTLSRSATRSAAGATSSDPKQVGIALFGPYLIGGRARVDAAARRPRRRLSPRPARRAARRTTDDGRRFRWNTGCCWPAILFALGLIGVLVRRNLIFILMSIEIMMNAAGLAFVVAGARWGQPTARSCSSSSWRWRPPKSRSASRSSCSSITASARSTPTPPAR